VHCRKHKAPNEVDVVNERCQDCTKRATFGEEGKTPAHCKKHKKKTEIDVRSLRCTAKGCRKQPSYGIKGHRPVHCKKHQAEDEVEVRSPHCQAVGCETMATYGIEGRKPLHCLSHKASEEADVMNRRCDAKGCTTQPSFGIDGEKPMHCKKHKEENEVDVLSRWACRAEGCSTLPTFGIEWQKPLHCRLHKDEKETDVCCKFCSVKDCKTRAVADGFCTMCHPNYKGPAVHGASKISCDFLDDLAREICQQSGASILHKHYDKKTQTVSRQEHGVPNTRYRLDGFLKRDDCKTDLPFAVDDAGLAIEFHGHLWHGYPDPKLHDKTNGFGVRVGDLYEWTMERMRVIKARGYTVVYIWESDYTTYRKGKSSRSLLSYCHVL